MEHVGFIFRIYKNLIYFENIKTTVNINICSNIKFNFKYFVFFLKFENIIKFKMYLYLKSIIYTTYIRQ
jgi:hypothetical protein